MADVRRRLPVGWVHDHATRRDELPRAHGTDLPRRPGRRDDLQGRCHVRERTGAGHVLPEGHMMARWCRDRLTPLQRSEKRSSPLANVCRQHVFSKKFYRAVCTLR